MIEVYMHQASLLCAPCTENVVMPWIRANRPDLVPADSSDEGSYDSDDWPKGPYPDGGGEADTPQHCDMCGKFLMNPLTPDGYDYVRGALRAYQVHGTGNRDVLITWAHFYGFDTSTIFFGFRSTED